MCEEIKNVGKIFIFIELFLMSEPSLRVGNLNVLDIEKRKYQIYSYFTD